MHYIYKNQVFRLCSLVKKKSKEVYLNFISSADITFIAHSSINLYELCMFLTPRCCI